MSIGRDEGEREEGRGEGLRSVAIFLRLIDSLKCTHPFLFALQQVESACSLDARKEPDRMGAYKPLDQSDVARDLAARIFRRARRSTRGGRPFRGKRLLALKTLIPLILLPLYFLSLSKRIRMVISRDRHFYDSIFLETRFLGRRGREIRLFGSVYSERDNHRGDKGDD